MSLYISPCTQVLFFLHNTFSEVGQKEFMFMYLVVRCPQNLKLPTMFPFLYTHSSTVYKLFNFYLLDKDPSSFYKSDATEPHVLFYLCFLFLNPFFLWIYLSTLLVCLQNQPLFTLSAFLLVFYFINFNLLFCSFCSFFL